MRVLSAGRGDARKQWLPSAQRARDIRFSMSLAVSGRYHSPRSVKVAAEEGTSRAAVSLSLKAAKFEIVEQAWEDLRGLLGFYERTSA